MKRSSIKHIILDGQIEWWSDFVVLIDSLDADQQKSIVDILTTTDQTEYQALLQSFAKETTKEQQYIQYLIQHIRHQDIIQQEQKERKQEAKELNILEDTLNTL